MIRSCLFLLLFAAPALAAWPDDPLVNVPVSLAAGEKYDVFAVSDGAGGAIVAWEDERGGDADIYVQRISAGLDGLPAAKAGAKC